MISMVINTAAGAPHAKHVRSSENVITPGVAKVPYSWRAYALKHFILPSYIRDPSIDEVIVSGIWEEGDGYTYVHVPPEHYSWADCIAQRHAGYEAASGSMLIFQHDDHIMEPADTARMTAMESNVVSPARYTRTRNFSGEKLNDGSTERYIDGHCAMYERRVIAKCPWNEVPTVYTLDKEHTKQILAAGFTIDFSGIVRCWDVEHGATPWL